MNILLIEDDERIVEFVVRGLRAEGFTIEVAQTGSQGLELGRSEQNDLIILDLMLPDLHGFDVCQQLRTARVGTPILMLTAMDKVDDKIKGLRLGADDYVVKPFAFAELVARIEALLRRPRSYETKPTRLQVADLVFDRETMQVKRGDDLIDLTAKELALLEFLMNSEGRVFSRTQILEGVWGYSADPLTNVVDVYIRRLRVKIDKDQAPQLIKTVRGIGYKIEDNGQPN